MSLQTIAFRPQVSMIEVMRRFRATQGTSILRARHTNGFVADADYWRIQFIGPVPQVADLLPEVAP